MKDENKNIDLNNSRPDGEDNFFNKVELPFGKSKTEVWETMADKLDKKDETRSTSLIPSRLWFGLAATILVLAGIFSVMRFYTTSIHNPSGQHLSAILPDGSVVEMNAQSTINYHPFWWQFSRELSFEGEAFFKVQKGEQFEVNSAKGKTIVLGTSFNIYSRDNAYKVSCLSGKVKVISTTKDEAILSPGYQAEVEQEGSIKVFKNKQATQSVSWREGMFTFTSTPLIEVILEIERQYNITISLNTETAYFYTGYFSREKPVEEVLDLICKTFGLTFEKKSRNDFQINE